MNLAGKAGGANKKRRTGDDSSYARSQPCFRLGSRVPHRHHARHTPTYCSRCSRRIIHPDNATTGLSDFGKGRDTAAGIVPPFYQRNYFYAVLSPTSLPHAFQYFTLAGPSSILLSSFPSSYSISKITEQFLPGTRNFKPRRITCFHSAFLSANFCFPARAVLLLLPFSSLSLSLFFPCNAIVLVGPGNTARRAGREISFHDISTTSRAFDVTGDACHPSVKRSNALLAR